MPDPCPRKAELRRILRQRRQSLSSREQSVAALALANSVVGLSHWSTAQRIALYLPFDGEIGTTPLAELARAQDKQLFLPVIAGDRGLLFADWQQADPLSNNRYDIPEPGAQAARCPPAQLDIIFLPLVAWDLLGGRLGMGAGYYDRALSGIRGPVLVGLAHASQQVERVPRDDWDISLDFVVTDTALYHCHGE